MSRARGLQTHQVQLPMGAVGEGAERGRRDGRGARPDADLCQEARGVRSSDRTPPGDPHRLADLATTLHASRCITHDALSRFLTGQDVTREVTMAKLATQRAAFNLTDACSQIHGGAGYMQEYGIERMTRDARLGPIGGGTDEIMRESLGKSLGL